MDLKEELQECPITDRLRIIDNLDGFSMGSVVAICRIRYVAAGVANSRGKHARVTAQQILHTPEATTCKNRAFA